MKVILLKDVRKVGRKDDVVDVADGYANNFLLRQNLAVPASPESVAALENKRSALEAKQAEIDAAVDQAVQSLQNARITIPVRATAKGGLFKSIGAADVIRAIAEQRGTHVPEEVLQLTAAIKTAGEHALALQSKHAKATFALVIEPTK